MHINACGSNVTWFSQMSDFTSKAGYRPAGKFMRRARIICYCNRPSQFGGSEYPLLCQKYILLQSAYRFLNSALFRFEVVKPF